jgi:hypothetical protein
VIPASIPQPPTTPNPTPGQQEPLGDQCPQCGVLKTFWLYNPFLPSSKTRAGWVLWRNQHCNCPDRRPAPPAIDPGLAALDRLLNWEQWRPLTFAQFPQTGWRRALPAYRFCSDYARRADPAAAGVCLVGPPSAPREHLLAALMNAARARGQATALVTYPHLLSLLSYETDLEAYRPARKLLKGVPQLAIAGLFADPATPLELKPVHQLLDDRARLGKTTHLSLLHPPAHWRDPLRLGQCPIQAEITLVIDRLTLRPVAVPA